MKKREQDHREREPAPLLEYEAVRRDDGARDAPIHSIHLLDGDSDSLLFLFEYLSAAGYNVSASSSAADAMMMIAKTHPQVLIADKDLRDLTGMELVQRVRALSPATRVILTTERLDGDFSHQLLRMGDVDLVVKPFEWKILMRAVERAVQGQHEWIADGADAPDRRRKQG